MAIPSVTILSNFAFSTLASAYRISSNIDSDFNLVIWRLRRDRQINLHHYRSIYTTSMGFSTYSTQNCQFKIPPTAFFKQTTKYNDTNNSAYMVYTTYTTYARK